MLRPKRLGHIVLRVLDLERSIKFYSEILGLTNTFSIANKMHFMSASGDSSHELALVSIGNKAQRPNSNMVGLSHFAWQMNSIEDLESLYLKLQREHVEILEIDKSLKQAILSNLQQNELNALAKKNDFNLIGFSANRAIGRLLLNFDSIKKTLVAFQ